MQSRRMGVVGMALLLGLAGCEESTGPEESATIRLAAVGDVEAGPSTSRGASDSQAVLASDGSAQGTVQFTARVYVQSNSGAWVAVMEQAAQSVTVDASGRGGTQVIASESLEARSYNRVRVVFERVNANVTGGIQLGIGGLLTGAVQVNLGSDSEVVVEREVEVNAQTGSTTTIVINLNADAWLSKADAQAKAVSEAEFQSAVRIFAQSGSA
jgi:cytoskeletal protein RodZ